MHNYDAYAKIIASKVLKTKHKSSVNSVSSSACEYQCAQLLYTTCQHGTVLIIFRHAGLFLMNDLELHNLCVLFT